MVRINDARDLGLVVRDGRRRRRMTQEGLARASGVSRRWLADLEAGKPGAEVGLVLRTLAALGIALDAQSATVDVDLDEVLRCHRDTGA